MKSVGSFAEYEDERNRDLLRVYDEIRHNNPNLPLPLVYAELVERQSKRFWVSEERASIVISSMLRGNTLDGMLSTKKEMYKELFARYNIEKEKHGELSNIDIIFNIVNSPAPKFYLTPGSAKIIIHKMKHKWYEERKRRYRFLFM